jgi:short-subunit dehydrogenase involved in D-alanine esterification of teichoic acids
VCDVWRLKIERGNVHAVQNDVSAPKVIEALHDRIVKDFPSLNILVNNAGIMRNVNLRDGLVDFADGLHAFTQALRVQTSKTAVKIFELEPAGTETPLFGRRFR